MWVHRSDIILMKAPVEASGRRRCHHGLSSTPPQLLKTCWLPGGSRAPFEPKPPCYWLRMARSLRHVWDHVTCWLKRERQRRGRRESSARD